MADRERLLVSLRKTKLQGLVDWGSFGDHQASLDGHIPMLLFLFWGEHMESNTQKRENTQTQGYPTWITGSSGGRIKSLRLWGTMPATFRVFNLRSGPFLSFRIADEVQNGFANVRYISETWIKCKRNRNSARFKSSCLKSSIHLNDCTT